MKITRRQLVAGVWRPARIVLCAYCGVILVLLFLENRFVYHPSGASDWIPAPSKVIQDVYITSGDGTKLHAWWCPYSGADVGAGGVGVVLYCHGNAGNLSYRGGSILKMRDALQTSVLIFDYPGYGKSEGTPSEQGCYLAGEAAYDWLVNEKKFKPSDIMIYGGSLGGGVAIHLAARKPYRALILAKTFTSAPDVAASVYPWLPVRWLMRNRFDNLALIRECRSPVFICHGTKDAIVPIDQARTLFEAANEPKHFCTLEGADHNDPLPKQFFEELNEFLRQNISYTN